MVKVNFEKDYDFKVYPNPARDNIELQIVANKGGNAEIYVYNSLGAVVDMKPLAIKKGNNSTVFNLNGYSKGVYHMKIKTENNLNNITFVVE